MEYSDNDIQILEVRDRPVEIEIVSNNKENYIYSNNFNNNFYNNITYPLELDISSRKQYQFTLSRNIKGDGHCGYHCMNVTTTNTLNNHFDIREDIAKFYENMLNDNNFANDHSWIYGGATTEALSRYITRVRFTEEFAPRAHWCNDVDFSVYGYLHQIRYLIYSENQRVFNKYNKTWRFYESEIENINNWPLILINFDGGHFDIITNVVDNNLVTLNNNIKNIDNIEKKSNNKTKKKEKEQIIPSSTPLLKLGNQILNIIETDKKSMDSKTKMYEVAKVLNLEGLCKFITTKKNEKNWNELKEFEKLCKSIKKEETFFILKIKNQIKKNNENYKILKDKKYVNFLESLSERKKEFFKTISIPNGKLPK